MKIDPKNGFGPLEFGMKQSDVELVLGKPNASFKDEENNTIYLYNALRLRLTFYEEEQFKLGYIITSHPEAVLLGHKVMQESVSDLVQKVPFKNWETETFDSTVNYFNDSNWLTLQSEFGTIIRVELGAVINEKDEFVWRFK